MIKTKSAFLTFAILCVIIFPYYIIHLQSDFLSSIVPGWNTSIIPQRIISNLIKFFILIISVYLYFKLSKISEQINFKKFIFHFLLTLPAVVISKLNVYKMLDFNSFNPEGFLSQIQIVVLLNIVCNILFFISQILFWRFYFKFKKSIKFKGKSAH